jgi:hypothetical protein
VLICNTLALGGMILLLMTLSAGTPIWLVIAMLFTFGFLQSLQYTSMNTLAYSDIDEEQASAASTIASTVQQMSLSFAVAIASLTAELFIPNNAHAQSAEMIHGIHLAFLVLGGWTMVSTLVFTRLKDSDGDAVSRYQSAPGAT